MNRHVTRQAVRHRRGCPGVVSPQLLAAIARNGSPEQRDRALATLAVDSTWRLLRATAPRPGSVPLLVNEPATGPHRTVADAHGTEVLPGNVVRIEGGPAVGDPPVDEAYDGLGATFAFYLSAYGRHSIDDQGLPLDATVHYGQGYDNAFWNGERMVFGDGDGELFGRFTASLDVIGHELTHGVTADEANLRYAGQPGALNESLSDVFGVLVKQYTLGQTAEQADWLIGSELLLPAVHGRALRDMAAPGTAYDDPVLGKDPQVGHLRDYVQTASDNGGVHVNSGIPNRAFHAVATALGGPAWERAGALWYEALRDPAVRPGTRFAGFAATTLRLARHRYGQTSPEAKAVREGWQLVGVLPAA